MYIYSNKSNSLLLKDRSNY